MFLGQQGTSRAHVIVTVERMSAPTVYVAWSGRSAASIQRAARAHYVGARVSFGHVWYTNSYGAH